MPDGRNTLRHFSVYQKTLLIWMTATEIKLDDTAITMEEVQKALSYMKNNKSAGIDGLPAEILKNGSEVMMIWMHRLFNIAWK